MRYTIATEFGGMMNVITQAILIAGLGIGTANADVLDEKAASDALFAVKATSVDVSDSLGKADAATVNALIPLLGEQMNQQVQYYSAIAYSPDEGLINEALQGALNFHSVGAAEDAALAACNALRKSGTGPCEIAARIAPKKYEPREFTLSAAATDGFRRAYRKLRGGKAFAISRSSGAWGMGSNDADALKSCEKDAGSAADCEIVIRD